MSNKNLLSKIPTNFLNEFIIKNNCDCNCQIDNYIKLIPREFDDMYLELYRELLYNLTIMKYVINRKRLLLLIKDIDNIITDFCMLENVYSEYGEDKIFYAQIPFYFDYNSISTIKISKGIDFSLLIAIKEETEEKIINNITNDLIEFISTYLIN